MESLLPELIAPILDCVTFESLQSLSMLESSWLESTKIALASRFEGAVTIAFVKGSDLVEYSMEKRPIRKQNRFFRMLSVFDAEPRSSWTFIPGDAANIETLSLSVKMIDPRKDKGLEEGVRQDRAPFLQEIGKVFRLMTSCRKVVINIAKLDAYPEDLLALLPRDGLPGKVFLDTIDCDVIPPFDIPIRLRRVPFDSLSTDALQEASTLHGEHALDWLQKLWHRQPHVMWDDPIPIFVDHSWFYLHPPYFFTMSPERLDSMYFVLIKRRYTMAQQHSTTRGKPLMTLDGFGYVQHKLNSVEFWNCRASILSDRPRTNNAIEGWHNAFKSHFGSAVHPSLSKIIVALQKEEASAMLTLLPRETDSSQPLLAHERRSKYVQVDKSIKSLVLHFDGSVSGVVSHLMTLQNYLCKPNTFVNGPDA
ncbi:hypothetical protein QR680_018839 [Steinernema hermaphroditum]|uniref:F-box domain-containing protein n=1 Tax=Steinernema hermaphroditum TaxID=289476 RepID=A0AA39HKG3_9BILA|nr:hypothetical protein QR680_018839 [Steinernema hermaphroditum]